ncbi:MAG: SDR family NAD(P)-dependent oxidoreductase [Rhodospirillales bacterium]|jgi:NAD(P)-dependent dehydrogenase (short-subunit alcohol dehydrogenase family)
MTKQSKSEGRLSGHKALITGGAGGLAIATARNFVREGAVVVLTDLETGTMDGIIEELTAISGTVAALACDVTDRAQVDTLMSDAAGIMGGIDILVTCAGGYKAYVNFEDLDVDEWKSIIDVNLTGVFHCCQAVLPHMKAAGWGRIINLGSLAGRSTSTGTAPAHYASSKAAVSMLTQTMAKDMAPYGITANTVAPSTTTTERVNKLLTPEKEALFTSMTPVGRLAEPEDISDVITFLASDESRYITGATIDVNGGRLMVL